MLQHADTAEGNSRLSGACRVRCACRALIVAMDATASCRRPPRTVTGLHIVSIFQAIRRNDTVCVQSRAIRGILDQCPSSYSTPTARCSMCTPRSAIQHRPGRRPHVGNLAGQAARIHLDADARRPLRRFLDADRARARLCAGARAVGRQGAQAQTARRLFQARRVPRRARGAWPLKEHGHQTAILSNGSPDMLKGAVDAAGIGGDLDAVLSVDAIHMFKPRPEVYGLVTEPFKCAPAT